MNDAESRFAFARDVVDGAASAALGMFHDRDHLDIEVKGLQDWVSNADKAVENQLRAALLDTWPQDSIIGEEHGRVHGKSGYTWVIDPIDGTTNFVNGTPGWCVVLACVFDERVVCSVVADPVSGETFAALRGQGATVNDRKMTVSKADSLSGGTLGVGHSNRVPGTLTVNLIQHLLQQQGLFRRGGSGALDLAYVAAGRLIGYAEPHMNAWDCLASLLMIEEAGGFVEAFSMQGMLDKGGRVVAACPGVRPAVQRLVEDSYG